MTEYVELHCRSAFSFLRGASTPEKLAERAAQLEMPALALCDRDGVYGAPRFYARARELGVRPIVGAELTMEDGAILPVLVESRRGYENLCQLLTRAHLRNEKGKCRARWEELPEFAEGLVVLASEASAAKKSLAVFGPRHVFIEIQRHRVRGEERTVRLAVDLAQQLRLPLLATNDVLYSTESERPILDVFTCIRNHTHLDAAGKLLAPNGERYLKSCRAYARIVPRFAGSHRQHRAPGRTTWIHAGKSGLRISGLSHSAGVLDGFVFARAGLCRGAPALRRTVPESCAVQLENELALIAKLKVCRLFSDCLGHRRILPRKTTSWRRGAAARPTARSVSASASRQWTRSNFTRSSSAS